MDREPTRPVDDAAARGIATRTFRPRRLLEPVVALSGVTLLVGAARAARDDPRRAAVLGVAGGGLLAAWVRRQGPPTATDPEAPGEHAVRGSTGGDEGSDPDVVGDGDDDADVVEADDDVPAPDVDETDDRM